MGNPLGYTVGGIDHIGEFIWLVTFLSPEGVPVRVSHFRRDGNEECIAEFAEKKCAEWNLDLGVGTGLRERNHERAKKFRCNNASKD